MKRIDKTDLRNVDLNLLVIFAALLEHRSVTRTAERLGIGQPAVSYSLKKLRELLDDPLFARTPTGMSPTPRALAMAESVRAILTSIETTLFARAAFEPASEARIFRVGALDYAQAVIADPLLLRLQKFAPGCRLILTATDCDAARLGLERGEIDVAVGAFPETVSAQHQTVLYREHYACVYDAAACEVRGAMTRARWLALPHVIMSTKADWFGPLDEVLRGAGQRREVMVSTPNFLAIPYLLRGKRLVASLPSRLAKMCRAEFGLRTGPLPFEAPEFDVIMAWSARTAKEPGAVWLREQIMSVCAQAKRP